jgi:hypothetical protein
MRQLLFVFLLMLTAHCSLLTAAGQGTPGTVRCPTEVDTLDSLFRIRDAAQAILADSLTSNATSITVSSTAAFPTSGSGKIESEVFYYTSKSGTQFLGVTRGASGTVAASHPNSALVSSPILAVHHNTLAEAVICAQEKALAAVPNTRTVNGHALVANVVVTPSDLTQDSTHRFATDAEKSTWNAKQDALGFTAVPNTRTVNGHALNANVTVSKSDINLGNAEDTSDANKPVSNAQQTALNLKENTVNRDATGGYPGLTAFKINFKNTAGTFISFFQNSNTAARTYTLQDRNGTLADDTDLAAKQSTLTNSAGLRAALSDENGTGVALFEGAASVSLITPNIGVAAATSINFGGTALSTYVEGSCTLSLKFGGNDVGMTYSIQVCKYTRIGNMVYVDAFLALSAKGSSTGTATITGLPVAATATANRYQVIDLRLGTVTFTGHGFGYIDPSSTTTITPQINNNGTLSTLLDSAFGNTSSILINAVYKTN